jgi:hypothetical protein
MTDNQILDEDKEVVAHELPRSRWSRACGADIFKTSKDELYFVNDNGMQIKINLPEGTEFKTLVNETNYMETHILKNNSGIILK